MRVHSNQDNVVVTGLGVVSSAGVGVDPLLRALQSCKSTATELIGEQYSQFPSRYACQVKDFNPLNHVKFSIARHMTRCSQLGAVAALSAVRDSGLDLLRVDHDRVHIYEGTSIGGMDRIFSDYETFLKYGYQKMNPTTSAQAFIGSTTGEIAILLALKSRSITVCSGSASSSDAIGFGFEQIKLGVVDIAIVGGAETPIVPGVIGSFCKAGVISTRSDGALISPRAFTQDRDGFTVGEGAAFLILERKEHAIKRGATIYAEVAGFGNGCDAHSMLSPHPNGDGVVLAAERAMRAAEISPRDVQYVNAHGTGTKLNDLYETVALKRIFEKTITDVRVSSTKPITGHLLGASGAIEAIACVLSVKHSFMPPLINYFAPDPMCDLNFVVNEPEKKNVQIAMSFNYGFGGKNSVLIFRKTS